MLNEVGYKEAAAHVGMRESGFRKLCRDGKGPKARRDGREVRFLPEHLDTWLEQYKVSAYSSAATKTSGTKATGKAKAGLPKELK